MLRLLRLLFPRAPRPQRAAPRRRAAKPSPGPYAQWLEDWGSLWGVPGLSAHAQVAFSGRLRSALGRCSPRSGAIRLNPALLDADPEVLREVVCHEAAHAAAWLLHGRQARPHGREWKALMRQAGYEPRVRWPEASVPEAVRERARRTARR